MRTDKDDSVLTIRGKRVGKVRKIDSRIKQTVKDSETDSEKRLLGQSEDNHQGHIQGQSGKGRYQEIEKRYQRQ